MNRLNRLFAVAARRRFSTCSNPSPHWFEGYVAFTMIGGGTAGAIYGASQAPPDIAETGMYFMMGGFFGFFMGPLILPVTVIWGIKKLVDRP